MNENDTPSTGPEHGDAEKLIAWLREAADELEKAHLVLDNFGIPRALPGSDVECTLAARGALLSESTDPSEADHG